MYVPGKERLDGVEPGTDRASEADDAPQRPRAGSCVSGTNGSHAPGVEGQAIDALLSPSIQRVVGERTAAFEVKFLVPEDVAVQIEHWATGAMQRDAFADPALGGSYQTTTLYLDTPRRDVFHRSPGFRRNKYRLRRYGSEPRLYLERKTRRGDRVAKRRCDVPLAELVVLTGDHAGLGETWPGLWFREKVVAHPLEPSCRLTYDRTAFVKGTPDGPLRLTLDRRIRGTAATNWDLTPLEEGHLIVPGHVICEFKFRGAMPNLFKEAIAALRLDAGSVSKYRRMMAASGAVADAVLGGAANGAGAANGGGVDA